MPTIFMLKSRWSVAIPTLSCLCALVLIGATEGSTLNNGYYRNADKPTVYRVLDGNVCAVLSEDHLSALGASHKSIHVVSDSIDFLNGKPFAPSCPWPDGFYRKKGGDQIIKVNDGIACIVSSTDEHVHTVTSDQQLLEGKNFVGRCKT
jgi:hypothetical protein